MVSKNEINYIRSLQVKKHRQQAGVFVAEGPRWMEDLLNVWPDRIRHIYALPGWIATNGARIDAGRLQEVSESELERMSSLVTPQQVLAVVEQPKDPIPPPVPGQWAMALDDIQDPGNLGTLIRIADWFGVAHMYAGLQTADCYNPKVVQASMGSLCRVAVHYTELQDLLQTANIPVYAAVMDGSPVHDLTKPEPGILLLGNEGKGLNPHLLHPGVRPVTIPRIGGAESLNVAVAAGILLSHLTALKNS